MPRPKRELTPFPPARCWKKYRAGKVHYVGKNLHDWSHGYKGTDTNDSAYQVALAEWRVKLAELHAEENTSPVSAMRVADAHDTYARLLAEFNGGVAPPPSVPAMVAPDVAASFAYRPLPTKTAKRSTVVTDNRSVAGLAAKFLEIKLKEADAGQFSLQHYSELKIKLDYFAEYAEHHGIDSVDEITAEVLSEFRSEELSRLTLAPPDGISHDTLKKRLRVVRDWLIWLEEQDVIDRLPGKLTKFHIVKKPKNGNGSNTRDESGQILTYTPDDVRSIFEAAPDRTKLYILLAANCGFTQRDIATLDWSHYEPSTGIIDRPRHKTKDSAGTRQRFKLWKSTRKLLSQFSVRGGGLMLTNDDGEPLVREQVRDDGSMIKIDVIAQAFKRVTDGLVKQSIFFDRPELRPSHLLTDAEREDRSQHRESMTDDQRKADTKKRNQQIARLMSERRKLDPRSFKTLRKSAADEIEKEWPELTELYLAHSERGMKKSYVNNHNVGLDGAVEYLDRLYGLTL